jgi:hypothetical protein
MLPILQLGIFFYYSFFGVCFFLHRVVRKATKKLVFTCIDTSVAIHKQYRRTHKIKAFVLVYTMKKTVILKLVLQFNFWVALDTCNSLYIHYNLLQLNYNFVTTIHFQLLCNSPDYNDNVMLTSFFIHPSKFNMWHYEDFSWFFKNIDIHCPWLFILNGLGFWHVA